MIHALAIRGGATQPDQADDYANVLLPSLALALVVALVCAWYRHWEVSEGNTIAVFLVVLIASNLVAGAIISTSREK